MVGLMHLATGASPVRQISAHEYLKSVKSGIRVSSGSETNSARVTFACPDAAADAATATATATATALAFAARLKWPFVNLLSVEAERRL